MPCGDTLCPNNCADFVGEDLSHSPIVAMDMSSPEPETCAKLAPPPISTLVALYERHHQMRVDLSSARRGGGSCGVCVVEAARRDAEGISSDVGTAVGCTVMATSTVR